MTKILSLLTFFFSFLAFGQHEYQLKGSFEIEGSKQKPVVYTLRWSEEENQISGKYSDNYYTDSAPVEGSVNNLGRLFKVELPEEEKGVKSIAILASEARLSDTATTLPVSVVTRDKKGNPLTTTGVAANFIGLSTVAQRQEEADCRENFGELAGFCGIYAGVISEQFDPRGLCDLMTSTAVRLELDDEGSVFLHLNRVSEIITTPVHHIGRLRAEPESTIVDVLSRSCRPLPGIDFPGDNCKRLNLRGSFTTERDEQHFEGTYTITDEATDISCRYGLSMDKQGAD
jgi:hypothetical protein